MQKALTKFMTLSPPFLFMIEKSIDTNVPASPANCQNHLFWAVVVFGGVSDCDVVILSEETFNTFPFIFIFFQLLVNLTPNISSYPNPLKQLY